MSIKTIEQVRNQVVSCTKCELCKTRNNSVPGKGNHNSRIIFIGEAPGRSEDKAGEPFVGAAGNILSELLATVGRKREDVFIANVVKCRPPGNRDPLPEEVEQCLDPAGSWGLGRQTLDLGVQALAIRFAVRPLGKSAGAGWR